MEVALTILIICCLLQSLALAALASAVPWLFWKCLETRRSVRAVDRKVRVLDEALAALAEAAGLGQAVAGAPPNGRGPQPPAPARR